MKPFDPRAVMTEIKFHSAGWLNVYDEEKGECLYAQPWEFLSFKSLLLLGLHRSSHPRATPIDPVLRNGDYCLSPL
jgi:hypothetical protein